MPTNDTDMMQNKSAGIFRREKLIANALVDVASELRLIDIDELITMIKAQMNTNISDIFNSSTELHYRPYIFRYAACAEYHGGWGEDHSVTFTLNIRREPVCVVFKLTMGSSRARVDILDEVYGFEIDDEAEKEAILAQVIDEARLGRADPSVIAQSRDKIVTAYKEGQTAG